jgi:hypothetical protein
VALKRYRVSFFEIRKMTPGVLCGAVPIYRMRLYQLPPVIAIETLRRE